MGYVDVNGIFTLVGRKKQMIIRPDGHDVFPSEISSVINQHSAVADCLVVGIKDNDLDNGEWPTAFIQIAPEYLSKCNTVSEITKQVQLLQTIPGVGFLGAVTLISEIGDFSRFKKPKQLYAYFGLDPEVKQSGNFNGTKVKISKRGSGYARKVIYLIAMQSISSNKNGVPKNSVLRDFYLEKCKAKSKKTALGAVMHKICNIVFAVLRDEKAFVLKTPQ